MTASCNRYVVMVEKTVGGGSSPAELQTKAHTVILSSNGELIVEGVGQRRHFSPDMWDTLTVAWIEPQPPFDGPFNA